MSALKPDVHIVGLGARTPLGACGASTAAAVRARVSQRRKHPHVIDSAGQPMIVVRVPFLPEETLGVDRFIALAQPALAQALAPLHGVGTEPVPVILGIPPERQGLPEFLAHHLQRSIEAAEAGACRIGEVTVIPAGHASGLMALEAGRERILSGRCEFCAVGGVDSYLEPETLEWLETLGQVNRAGNPKNARGFTPSEAAGFCLLASDRAVARFGLDSLSRVISVVTAWEKNLIKTDAVCVGAGLSEAFRGALKEVPSDCKMDHLICDQNGEIYRAEEFGFTFTRTSARFSNGFQVPAQCWGDVGAASGPLFMILAIEAGHKGYAKGPHALLSTSSEGGERAAAILHTAIRINERA